MDVNTSGSFTPWNDSVEYIIQTTGLQINQTSNLPGRSSVRPSILNLLPLIMGIIGLSFNIVALLIFTASKTFRQSSFCCYIYAFVLVNCASIVT